MKKCVLSHTEIIMKRISVEEIYYFKLIFSLFGPFNQRIVLRSGCFPF